MWPPRVVTNLERADEALKDLGHAVGVDDFQAALAAAQALESAACQLRRAMKAMQA